METNSVVKKEKLAIKLVIVLLSVSIAAIIANIVLLVQWGITYGVAPGLVGVTQTLFQTSAYFVMLVLLGSLVVLFVKLRREMILKIFAWGMMLFSVVYVSPVFSQMLFILDQFEPLALLMQIAIYAPMLCSMVALIATLVQWDSTYRLIASKITMICGVVAAFFVVFFAVFEISQITDWTTFDIAFIFTTILSGVAVILLCIYLSIITSSRRVFDRLVFAMSEEEARVIENVEDRMDDMAEEIEEEIYAKMMASVKKEAETVVEAEESAEGDTELKEEQDKE